MTEPFLSRLSLLSTLPSKSDSRTWFSTPHSSLPLLASCSSDKSIKVHSLSTFTLQHTITDGHKRSIRSLAWKPSPGHPDTKVLASASFDASVGIWICDGDGESGLGLIGGGEQDVASSRLKTRKVNSYDNDEDSDDEFRLAMNQTDEDDNGPWRYALVLDGHDSEVKSLAFSPSGTLLATCSRDKSVWIWEEIGPEDYETIAVLSEHAGDVKTVDWHPEEELLASGSYDDDIRLWKEDADDWECCAVLSGHGATVWCVKFEPLHGRLALRSSLTGDAAIREGQENWVSRVDRAGARLASCSDDLSIRIWRRVQRSAGRQNTMSIIRSGASDEDWICEATLPKVHLRSVYAISWAKDGRLVSCGGDGRVVVYQEVWDGQGEAVVTDKVDGTGQADGKGEMGGTEKMARTTWKVVAMLEDAHGVFEVNHVTWAPRADGARKVEGEEVVVTCGDDGEVKVWCLDE